MQQIVDADNHALNLTYSSYDLGGGYYITNFLTQITDWAGRTVKLRYDFDSGANDLIEIVDAADITNRMAYDQYHWITNLVTPYGTTTFDHYQLRAAHTERRFVTITEPNGAKRRYYYESADDQVPNAIDPLADGTSLPSGTPYDNNFIWNPTDRNSYYWDPRNFELLSLDFKNDPASNWPTSTDYLQGRARHWLGSPNLSGVIGHTLGVEREASPDGNVEGQITFYAYEGQEPYADWAGTQVLPGIIARVMPDSTTWYKQYSHNEYGLVTQTTEKWVDNGNTLYRTHNYHYDDANGIDLLTHYGPDGSLEVGYGYDSTHPHLPVRMTNALLTEISYHTYDSLHRLWTIQTPSDMRTTNTYGIDGYLQTVVDAMGTTPFRTNQYTYFHNHLRTHTDERNLTVTYTYDNLSRLTQKDYPDTTYEQDIYTIASPYPNSTGGTSILDRTGHQDRLGNWTYYQWTANRQLATVTDARTTVTAYDYCTCGSLEYLTHAWNTPIQEATHYTYDSQGRRTRTDPPFGSGITSVYDLLGRLITTTDALGIVTNVYDNLGRLTAVKDAGGLVSATVYDVMDRVLVATDRNGVSVTNTYDALGRIRTRTYPDTGVEAYGYTANVGPATSYTNQLLTNVWTYAYDAAGRETNEIGVGVYTNSFAYWAASDLRTLKDGKDHVTTWNYDEYGRVTNKLDQASVEILRYKYDADSRLTNRWSKGKTDTKYSYDNVGNLTFVDYPPGTADITLQYDALNRLTNEVTASLFTNKYTYYAGGLLATEDGPWPSDTVTYTYNNARLRSSLALQQPTGSWVQNYYYDGAKRLTNIVSPAGSFTNFYSGDVGGTSSSSSLIKKVALPNTSYITNTYDNVARLTGTYLDNSANTVLDKSEYLYNAANQRIRHTRIDGSYYTNIYDNIGQLKWADSTMASEDRGYLYDAAWNLNKRTNNVSTDTFLVDSKNQYSTGPGGTFTYDDNGNLTYYGQTFSWERYFTYDAENQLVTVEVPGYFKSTFTYDGRGRRRQRTEYTWNGSNWVFAQTINYIYDGMRVIQERDNSGNAPLVSYTRGNDLSGTLEGVGGIGGLLARSHGYSVGSWTGHNFYHADGNGNVTMLIDNSTTPNVTASYRYDPFGNTISKTGTNANANLYRFSSKEVDPNYTDSGLYYYGYRFYDPNLQRWLNRDPIEDPNPLLETVLLQQTGEVTFAAEIADSFEPAAIPLYSGGNLYGFVRNNPINGLDSLGLADTGGKGQSKNFTVKNVTITHYCNCEKCTGKNPGDKGYGVAADGTTCADGHVSADWKKFPKGAKLTWTDPDGKVITGTVHDKGGAIKGNHIDVWCKTHDDALKKGKYKADIKVELP